MLCMQLEAVLRLSFIDSPLCLPGATILITLFVISTTTVVLACCSPQTLQQLVEAGAAQVRVKHAMDLVACRRSELEVLVTALNAAAEVHRKELAELEKKKANLRAIHDKDKVSS